MFFFSVSRRNKNLLTTTRHKCTAVSLVKKWYDLSMFLVLLIVSSNKKRKENGPKCKFKLSCCRQRLERCCRLHWCCRPSRARVTSVRCFHPLGFRSLGRCTSSVRPSGRDLIVLYSRPFGLILYLIAPSASGSLHCPKHSTLSNNNFMLIVFVYWQASDSL